MSAEDRIEGHEEGPTKLIGSCQRCGDFVSTETFALLGETLLCETCYAKTPQGKGSQQSALKRFRASRTGRFARMVALGALALWCAITLVRVFF
jgi:hypothetical protein